MHGIAALRHKIERINAALQPTGGVRQFLATTGVKLVTEGNARDRREGLDSAGNRLRPLAASTLDDRARNGDPPGPPLLRRKQRLISEFRAEVAARSTGVRIDCGWPGLDWVRHHRSGGRRLPVRHVGLSERTRASVRDEFRQYLAERFLP